MYFNGLYDDLNEGVNIWHNGCLWCVDDDERGSPMGTLESNVKVKYT